MNMTPIEQHYDDIRMLAAFKKQMTGVQYGEEETADALAWFHAGWLAARESVPDKKEYQHGRDFFQGEGQDIANAKVDGWNECRAETLK